ncbi:MAG: PIN domain-containing protein [Acidobacteriota bacterium]
MIGLDTNVLVRYLTQDDPAQSKKATRILETEAAQGNSFFLTSIVMCELVWVLGEAYGYSRSETLTALERILRTAQFEFEDKDQLWQALVDYRGGKADFSDYLIGRLGKQSGCEKTLTFDKDLRNTRLFRVL